MSTFEQGCDEYMHRYLAGARRGLEKAGFQLMADAVMDAPTVPLDEGTLRGSGSVFVGNDLIATSEALAAVKGGGKPTPATELGEQLAEGTLRATVGFNTAYAAAMHEGTTLNFQHDGSGAKFLEQKVVERHDDYMQIIANEVEKEVGGARAA